MAAERSSEDGCKLLCKRDHYCEGPWDGDEYREGEMPDNDVWLVKKCPGLSESKIGSSSIKHCHCPVTLPSQFPLQTAPLQSRRDVSDCAPPCLTLSRAAPLPNSQLRPFLIVGITPPPYRENCAPSGS